MEQEAQAVGEAAQPMASIGVLHLNVRSIHVPAKREKVHKLLEDRRVDVGVLTETWLSTRVDISTERFRVIRSPPGKHQGVAVALSTARFEHLRPLHQDLHTVHTVVVIARTYPRARDLRQELIIVGHYSQNAEKKQCQQELDSSSGT